MVTRRPWGGLAIEWRGRGTQVRFLIVAIMLALTAAVEAAPAEGPAILRDSAAALVATDPADVTVRRQRVMEFEPDALAAINAGAGGVLRFDLFEEFALHALFERFEPRGWPQEMTFTWVGSLVDDRDGWFILVMQRGVLLANFWTGDGRAFEIRPAVHLAGIEHAVLVRELDPSRFAPCLACPLEAGAGAPHLHIGRRSKEAAESGGSAWVGPIQPESSFGPCPDDGSFIDVLIVYTPSARNAAGGVAAIEGIAHMSITSSNEAYENSLIVPRLRLAHVGEVNYFESGSFGVDLNNLRVGVVPGVHALREQHRADLVAMLTTGTGACGIAYVMTELSTGFAAWAFSVTNYTCAVGNLTFAHELGHNMGCHHDRENATQGLYPYSYGWRWTTTGGQLRRSVMAYSPGTRVPHFSNPDVLNGGVPTGMPVGHPQQAHNALTINNSAPTVALFRQSECPPPGNDTCPEAWLALDGEYPIFTHGATTTGPDEPGMCTFNGYSHIERDVWFKYFAQCTGTATVDLCEANFNTKIAVYVNCPTASGQAIACNDDFCGLQSRVSFPVTAGAIYRIRIGGVHGKVGTGSMIITCTPACPADISPPGGDGIVNVNDLLAVINAWGPCTPGQPCPADIAPPGGDGLVNVNDLLEVINSWGPCPN